MVITIIIIVIVIVLIISFWKIVLKRKFFGGGITKHSCKYIGAKPQEIPYYFKDFFINLSKDYKKNIETFILHSGIRYDDNKEHKDRLDFLINVMVDIYTCKLKGSNKTDITYYYNEGENQYSKRLEVDNYYRLFESINSDVNKYINPCSICHLKITSLQDIIKPFLSKFSPDEQLNEKLNSIYAVAVAQDRLVLDWVINSSWYIPNTLYSARFCSRSNKLQTVSFFIFYITYTYLNFCRNAYPDIWMKQFNIEEHDRISYLGINASRMDQQEYPDKYNINGEFYLPISWNITYNDWCGQVDSLNKLCIIFKEKPILQSFLLKFTNRVLSSHKKHLMIYDYKFNKLFFGDISLNADDFVYFHERFDVESPIELIPNKAVRDNLKVCTTRDIDRCMNLDLCYLLIFLKKLIDLSLKQSLNKVDNTEINAFEIKEPMFEFKVPITYLKSEFPEERFNKLYKLIYHYLLYQIMNIIDLTDNPREKMAPIYAIHNCMFKCYYISKGITEATDNYIDFEDHGKILVCVSEYIFIMKYIYNKDTIEDFYKTFKCFIKNILKYLNNVLRAMVNKEDEPNIVNKEDIESFLNDIKEVYDLVIVEAININILNVTNDVKPDPIDLGEINKIISTYEAILTQFDTLDRGQLLENLNMMSTHSTDCRNIYKKLHDIYTGKKKINKSLNLQIPEQLIHMDKDEFENKKDYYRKELEIPKTVFESMKLPKLDIWVSLCDIVLNIPDLRGYILKFVTNTVRKKCALNRNDIVTKLNLPSFATFLPLLVTNWNKLKKLLFEISTDIQTINSRYSYKYESNVENIYELYFDIYNCFLVEITKLTDKSVDKKQLSYLVANDVETKLNSFSERYGTIKPTLPKMEW
jgi:hypothetical protein